MPCQNINTNLNGQVAAQKGLLQMPQFLLEFLGFCGAFCNLNFQTHDQADTPLFVTLDSACHQCHLQWQLCPIACNSKAA